MEEQLLDLAGKGTGWLIAVFLFFRYIAEKDKRLEDSKQTNLILIPYLKELQKTLDKMLRMGGQKSAKT